MQRTAGASEIDEDERTITLLDVTMMTLAALLGFSALSISSFFTVLRLADVAILAGGIGWW